MSSNTENSQASDTPCKTVNDSSDPEDKSLADFERASRILGISAFDLWCAYKAAQAEKPPTGGQLPEVEGSDSEGLGDNRADESEAS